MTQRLTIHKFGGAALADAEAIRQVTSIVTGSAAGAPRVVVASALAGVTETLLDAGHTAAAATPEESASIVDRLRSRHLETVDALLEGDDATALRRVVHAAFDELGPVAHAVRLAGAASLRDLDLFAAHGERLAAQIVAASLRRAGLRAVYVDAAKLIVTDGVFGNAAAALPLTIRASREALRPLLAAGIVPVVPGFIGAGPRGDTVTLGRGGSDLTATLLARALHAAEVILWKDVPGLLTADPRIVRDARVVQHLHVREAAEIAQYGARVLHPGTLVPLLPRTRLYVRPFADPASPGTRISAQATEAGPPIRALASAMDQALVSVAGRGLISRPGLVARAFIALDAAGIGAGLISQATTEYAFAFTVPNVRAAAALDALRAALQRERSTGEIETIDARVGVATVGVVGLGLASEAGVAARVFGALATRGINVLAAAQGGGSGGSLSIVLDATRAAEAQQVIHAEFQLHRTGGGRRIAADHVDVVVLGAGRIGCELLTQLAERSRTALPVIRICGVIDSTGYVFDPLGLSRRRIGAVCRHKLTGGTLAELADGHAATAAESIVAVSDHALSRPILVDATASETTELLLVALARSWDVVLANKVPLAADRADAERLGDAARAHGRRVLHEATVGAGLPVIDTLRKLIDAGDRIVRIEGCPSGTLGYLFGELGRGRSFSSTLRTAIAAGYTEPDPRVDLSGVDVARKALILGRLVGFSGDLADVAVESLVPPALRDVSCEEFLSRIEELDAPWDERVHEARASGRRLRYRARITPRGVAVGLVAVDAADPLSNLSGTDNQFSFTTARYRAQPLVITGPGAGPGVTAAGVVNDILQLASADDRGRDSRSGAAHETRSARSKPARRGAPGLDAAEGERRSAVALVAP